VNNVEIEEIQINEEGNLLVKPVENPSKMFRFIYRAEMEVDWNEDLERFTCPEPREWSYFDWYKQVIYAVVSEMGIILKTSNETNWRNISNELKSQIENYVFKSST